MISLTSVADRVVSVGEGIRPLWLRRLLFSSLLKVYSQSRRIQALISQLRLPVSIVSGESKNGERLCLMFIGREAFSLYLSDLLFKQRPRIEPIKKVFLWRLHHVVHVVPDNVNGILVSCDRFYQRHLEKAECYVFPHFVDMVLGGSDPDDVLKRMTSSARDDVRKVRKYGYFFEMCSDVDDLHLFYKRMYLPLIASRYRDAPVYTPPFMFFRWLWLIGYQLVFIKDSQKEVIAGCFYGVNKDMATVRYLGVINGDLELVRKGAESAIYYFFVHLLENREIQSANFGGVRPFFTDGLFWYKQKWGMTVWASDFLKEIFGLRIIHDTGFLNNFLIEHPFISINTKKELTGYIFVNKEPFDDAVEEELEKRFSNPGISRFRFIKV